MNEGMKEASYSQSEGVILPGHTHTLTGSVFPDVQFVLCESLKPDLGSQ